MKKEWKQRMLGVIAIVLAIGTFAFTAQTLVAQSRVKTFRPSGAGTAARVMANPAEPLFKQLGQASPIKGLKTDFIFTGDRFTAGAASCSHIGCSDPDDPIGCIDDSESSKGTDGFFLGLTVGGVTPPFGRQYSDISHTVYARLAEMLPSDAYASVHFAMMQSFKRELAAAGAPSLTVLLHTTPDVVRRAGEIYQKYDISLPAWEPTYRVLHERFTSQGVNVNLLQFTEDGLRNAKEQFGDECKNFGYPEALETIKRTSGM